MKMICDAAGGGLKKAVSRASSRVMPRMLPAKISPERAKAYHRSLKAMIELRDLRAKNPDAEITPKQFVEWKSGVFEGKSLCARTVREWDRKTSKGKFLDRLVPKLRGPKTRRFNSDDIIEIAFPLVCQKFATGTAAKKCPRPSGFESFKDMFNFAWKSSKKGKPPSIRTVNRVLKQNVSKMEMMAAELTPEELERAAGARSTVPWETRPYTVQVDHGVEDYVPFEIRVGKKKVLFSISLAVEPTSSAILSGTIFEGSLNERKFCRVINSLMRFDCPEGHIRRPKIIMIDGERAHFSDSMKGRFEGLGIHIPEPGVRRPQHRGAVENKNKVVQNTVLTAFENCLRVASGGKIVVSEKSTEGALNFLQTMLRVFIESHNSHPAKRSPKESRLEMFRKIVKDIPPEPEENVLPHLGTNHFVTVQRGRQTQVTVEGNTHNVYCEGIRWGVKYNFIECGGSKFSVYDFDGNFVGTADILTPGTPERNSAQAVSRQEQAAARRKVRDARRTAAQFTKNFVSASKKAPESAVQIVRELRPVTDPADSVATDSATAQVSASSPLQPATLPPREVTPFVRVRSEMRPTSVSVLP